MTNSTANQVALIPRNCIALLVVVLLSASSCGPNEVVTRIPEDHARLKALVTVYAYACRDLKRPPKNVEELMPTLEKAKVYSPREYLTSTRDGQPYAIVWGLDLEGRYLGANSPLAYERVGQDGLRLLVTCDQEVMELSVDEMTQVEWPPGHEPWAEP